MQFLNTNLFFILKLKCKLTEKKIKHSIKFKQTIRKYDYNMVNTATKRISFFFRDTQNVLISKNMIQSFHNSHIRLTSSLALMICWWNERIQICNGISPFAGHDQNGVGMHSGSNQRIHLSHITTQPAKNEKKKCWKLFIDPKIHQTLTITSKWQRSVSERIEQCCEHTTEKEGRGRNTEKDNIF